MSTPSSHTSFSPSRWHRRPEGRVTDLGRLLLGLCVVAVGTLLLLGAAGVLDAGRAIDRWWPLVLVAAGLFTLAERPPAVVRGLLLTAAGATLLLFTTDTVDENAGRHHRRRARDPHALERARDRRAEQRRRGRRGALDRDLQRATGHQLGTAVPRRMADRGLRRIFHRRGYRPVGNK